MHQQKLLALIAIRLVSNLYAATAISHHIPCATADHQYQMHTLKAIRCMIVFLTIPKNEIRLQCETLDNRVRLWHRSFIASNRVRAQNGIRASGSS